MLADPQTITINAVPITVPRITSGNYGSEYCSSDGNTKLTISHSYGRRNRRVVRIDRRKIAADPVTNANAEVSTSVYVVIDHPRTGFTETELKQLVDSLTGFLTASSGAATTKIIGGES